MNLAKLSDLADQFAVPITPLETREQKGRATACIRSILKSLGRIENEARLLSTAFGWTNFSIERIDKTAVGLGDRSQKSPAESH